MHKSSQGMSEFECLRGISGKVSLITSVQILQFLWNFEHALNLWFSLNLSNFASNAFYVFESVEGNTLPPPYSVARRPLTDVDLLF